MNTKLAQIKPKQKYYICGDINIDVNPINFSNHATSYMQVIASIGAFLIIGKPTRVTNFSKTTIDHIISNDVDNVIYPGIFLSDITDHYPIACIVSNRNNDHSLNKQRNSNRRKYRRLSNLLREKNVSN